MMDISDVMDGAAYAYDRDYGCKPEALIIGTADRVALLAEVDSWTTNFASAQNMQEGKMRYKTFPLFVHHGASGCLATTLETVELLKAKRA